MSDDTFRWVITIAVLMVAVAAVVGVVAILGAVSAFKKLQTRALSVIGRAEPILDTARRVFDESAPKIATITTDAVDIVRLARDQTERLGELVKDFSERAKVQVARIDGTIDHTIDDVQGASTAMKGAVLRPVREVNGVLSGIKTALAVYALGRRASVNNATQDEEMFI